MASQNIGSTAVASTSSAPTLYDLQNWQAKNGNANYDKLHALGVAE